MLSRTRFGAFLAVIMTLARRRVRRRRCHEQEDEPVQVGAEGFDAVGSVADEGGVAIGEGLFVAAGRLARKNSAVR